MNTSPTSGYIKGLIYLISRSPLIFCSMKCLQKVKRAKCKFPKSKNNKDSVHSDWWQRKPEKKKILFEQVKQVHFLVIKKQKHLKNKFIIKSFWWSTYHFPLNSTLPNHNNVWRPTQKHQDVDLLTFCVGGCRKLISPAVSHCQLYRHTPRWHLW